MFPRSMMTEHPIRQVYNPPMEPVKNTLSIIGIPEGSHDIWGYSGKRISKGGPGIASNAAARAPSIVASARFLVSSFSNCSSPLDKKRMYAK